jgi:hypothetical protein
MSFSISLEHTKSNEWQQQREIQWAELSRQSFPSDATENDLKPYRDYFFEGDVAKAIETGKFNGFRSILFWSPANNLKDVESIFSYYWKWFLGYEDKERICQNHGCLSPEEYLNSILIDIAGWTYFLPEELAAKIFLWVFGDTYICNRDFSLLLGDHTWVVPITVNSHDLAFYLLRGVKSYLFSYKYDPMFKKYVFLLQYFLSVFSCLNSKIYTKSRVDKNVKLFNNSDQIMVRWFIANLEGVVTKREIKKNNSEVPHNDLEKEVEFRKGISELNLPVEFYQLVKFIHLHGERCLIHFEE